MRLIGYEFQKIFQKKLLLLLWALSLLALLFSFYWKCRDNDIYNMDLYEELSEKYTAMDPEAALEELERESSALSLLQTAILLRGAGWEETMLGIAMEGLAAEKGLVFQDIQQEYAEYAEDSELLLDTSSILNDLESKYQYSQDYRTFLEEMPQRAEKLQSISIFVKPDSFSYRNILKSVEDYGRLGDVEITVDYDRGLLTLARDKTPMLFLLVVLLFFAVTLYPEETDSGMIRLLTANKKGRLPLALAKWVTLSLVAVVTALILSLGRVALAGKVLGFGDMTRSLQSSSYFRNCCYTISVGGYIGVTVLSWVLVLLFAGVLLSLLFWVFKDVRIAGGIYGVYLMASYLAYQYIDDASVWNIWKFLNPFAFADVGGRFSSYQNLNLFGYPVSVFLSGAVFFIVVAGAMLAGYLAAFTCCFQVHFSIGVLRRRNRIKGSTSLWAHEMFRLWIGSYGVIILAALLILGYESAEKEELLLSEEEYIYYTYSQELAGEITEETDAWMAEENDRLMQISARSSELVEEYKQGELGEDAFMSEMREQEQASIQKKAFERVYSQYQQVKAAQEEGVPVHFVNAIATDAMFENLKQYVYRGMLLLLICILSLCGVFSVDYQTGMIFLVHTTRKGRGPLFRVKYGVMLLLYTLGFICFTVPYWYNWLAVYRMSDWNAPLQSVLQFTAVKGNISILGFCVVWFVQMYLSGCVFVVIQAMLSAVCRKNSTTLIVAGICIALDFLISGFSLRWLAGLVSSSGYGLPMLLEAAGGTLIVWIELVKLAVLTAALLFWHRRIYVR